MCCLIHYRLTSTRWSKYRGPNVGPPGSIVINKRLNKVLATGLVATTVSVNAETGKTAGIADGDSKGFGTPSKAAAVGSKTSTGSWLVARSVSVFKLVASESPDVKSSKFGVGERRRSFEKRCPNPLAQTLPSSKLWWTFSCFVISMLQTFQKTRC
jgi:hypothetical protein